MQDLDLLAKWRDARDATAFAQLVNRHAGMVYATCRRVLGSESDAEDVAQECFEMLAEGRGAPREHVGGWLHRVATNRAISRRRSDSRRHARESRYSTGPDPDKTVEWDDIYQYVDEALGNLPDDFRHAIVATMLEGETRAAVARLLGVSPSTVAYRIDKGVELIRGSLRKKGVAVPAAALSAWIAAENAVAAPASLVATLGKVAVSGAGASASTTAGGLAHTAAITGGLLVMKKTLVGALAILAVLAYLLIAEPFAEPQGEPSGAFDSPTAATLDRDEPDLGSLEDDRVAETMVSAEIQPEAERETDERAVRDDPEDLADE
jgi:RNA polymerase sigma factor (sigma-70 family)